MYTIIYMCTYFKHICIQDTPDWKEWDRSKTLEILLEQFEEVSIDVVSTIIIVHNQKELEIRRIENDAKVCIYRYMYMLMSII
jgi:hypothetical protein